MGLSQILDPKIPWLIIFSIKVALVIGYPSDLWTTQYQNYSPLRLPSEELRCLESMQPLQRLQPWSIGT